MYITVDDIKNEISLDYPIYNSNRDKKIGLIRAYFVYSFYNVEKDEKIHLKNGETLPVKRGCYTKKDIEKVSSEWKDQLKELVADRISNLKGHFKSPKCKVLDQLDGKDTLHKLHANYVLVPADKAANNVIIVCKKILY